MAKDACNIEQKNDFEIRRTQHYDFEKNCYVYMPMYTLPPGTVIRATVVALNQADIAQESTRKFLRK